MTDNNLTLVGSLTRDPELRYSPSGQANARMGIAVNRRWQKDGEWQEQVSFFNLVAWAQLAENCAESLTKGTRVICNGRLEQRSYETKDGEKKSVVEVVVDSIGPDLRWACATVVRNERKEPGAAPAKRPVNEQPVYDEDVF